MNINCTGCGALIKDILVRPALCEECQTAARYAEADGEPEDEVEEPQEE